MYIFNFYLPKLIAFMSKYIIMDHSKIVHDKIFIQLKLEWSNSTIYTNVKSNIYLDFDHV
jgi:hypothetical protein